MFYWEFIFKSQYMKGREVTKKIIISWLNTIWMYKKFSISWIWFFWFDLHLGIKKEFFVTQFISKKHDKIKLDSFIMIYDQYLSRLQMILQNSILLHSKTSETPTFCLVTIFWISFQSFLSLISLWIYR